MNVLDEVPERDGTWTTVNAGEAAFPGVPTPLSWTWGWWPTEYGVRGAFAAIGALPVRDAPPPAVIADRVITLQLGHAALNLDLFRRVGDATPGSSASEVERSFFGSVRPGTADAPARLRYPVVAAKLPATAVRARRDMLRLTRETDTWWRGVIGRVYRLDDARTLLVDAQRAYARIAIPHTAIGMVAQGLFDQVRALCGRVGMADRAGLLVPGGEEEGRWLVELWEVAQGRRPLDAFLAEHGYHGPLEGELSSSSWRDDPAPLRRLLEAYRGVESPAERFARSRGERAVAERELLAALPRAARLPARGLLGAARAYMPLRESGRATFLRAYDAARVAARAIGGDDVFFLTFDEALGRTAPGDVEARRALRTEYQSLTLPNLWTGRPVPVPARKNGDGALSCITGQGVSRGVAEGIARVVVDPLDDEAFEEGDILVCHATDPSWAALFYLAAAVVIDLGGDMSHGAIVARELGLPAVVNTGDGTLRIRDGEHIRVDGTAGTVETVA